jgi:hypothetical protein
VLAPELDQLEMQAPPRERREELLQITLGLLDRAAAREAPTRRQPVDVRVDGEGRMAEGLLHHDARGLVADARQRLERLEIRGYDARVLLEQDPREARDRLRLRRREAARTDDAPDLRYGELSFPVRRANRRGVIWFTLASVHCAESNTATSSV